MPRIRQAILACALACLMAITGCLTGCTGSKPTQKPADIAREASDYGGIVLPPKATLLAARSTDNRVIIYQLAISTDPQGLTELLTASKFTAPLTRTTYQSEHAIAGPPLQTSPSLVRAYDYYSRPDGKHVNRTIVVDERDSSTRYVHIQLASN
ncbi:hypothetical protein K7711_25890 [Nocardia sp. CA2R105]|uniref:hypothetical protein n=1 Tax=Nocardia coffeae TaxID=2873381 RepID=UPI001CA6FCCB|nr:hypothetical protein [Nocardia coffeae]MBY8859927.1 hypothetical protein [Nocardia coffeae]